MRGRGRGVLQVGQRSPATDNLAILTDGSGSLVQANWVAARLAEAKEKTGVDTGARATELLSLRWEWIDWETGWLSVPAEARKGQHHDEVYGLADDTR